MTRKSLYMCNTWVMIFQILVEFTGAQSADMKPHFNFCCFIIRVGCGMLAPAGPGRAEDQGKKF